jgi:1-acyl-sn-glycerol-3-phosphate acyltransferase
VVNGGDGSRLIHHSPLTTHSFFLVLPMQHWLSERWYDLTYWVSWTTFTLGFSLRTEGSQHLPRQGPALLIANHQSYLDPIIIGIAARRHLCFLARKTLFRNRTFGWLLRSLNAVPIDQEGFAREGLKTTLAQLQAGQAVLIFPEGERSPHGKMLPLRPGIHLLIKKMAMPIIPIGVAGAYQAWPRWRAYPVPAPLFLPPEPGTIAVSIGRPLDARYFAELPRERVLADLFTELQKLTERAEHLRRK